MTIKKKLIAALIRNEISIRSNAYSELSKIVEVLKTKDQGVKMKIRKIKFMINNRRGLWLKRQPVCPECGKRGKHWVSNPFFNPGISANVPIDERTGFWICDKFYGPDGRRIL